MSDPLATTIVGAPIARVSGTCRVSSAERGQPPYLDQGSPLSVSVTCEDGVDVALSV